MEFRFDLPIQIADEGDDLSSESEVILKICYRSGRWSGRCADPPVMTDMCDTLQAAIVAAVRDIQKDWKAGV